MRYPRAAGICLLLILGSLLALPATAETQGSDSGTRSPGGRTRGLESALGATLNGLSLEGILTYNYQGTVLNMTAERVRNSRTSGVSGTLRLELWATTTAPPAPSVGQTISAYTLGTYTLGVLNAGTSFTNINSGNVAFTAPPPGTYYITMALMEFDGSQYVYQDFIVFSNLQTFGTTCTATSTALCLNNGRFRVTANWVSPTASGVGNAITMTGDTGYFWFFSANNVEMVIKVVNGCSFNSRYWTFAGGLTNVNVVMQVTDTQTGTVKTYTNPQGVAFAPIQDTSAFATCP
ncbi:MAG: hypothetical protein M3R62_04960 [Acidobacteriota bacterium]|nr:hypothetical protein [Acidobacteriota bacterium]